MNRFLLGFKLLFKAWFDAAFASRAGALLDDQPAATGAAAPAKAAVTPARPTAPEPPRRNDAITLLAVLQRESRLVDFLQEPIAAYSDAQIGAAVRDVHRDAAAVLDRLFGLKPVLEQPEGSDVTLAAPVDAGRIRLVGNVGSAAPASGKLQHPGWRATKTDLPQYSGSPDSATIIAPAEVEV